MQIDSPTPARNLLGPENTHAAPTIVVDLLPNFPARVELLSPQAILHPLKQFRDILCDWTANVIFAMNQSDLTAAALETARYKLFLGHVSKRCGTNTELYIRLKVWKDSHSNFFSVGSGSKHG